VVKCRANRCANIGHPTGMHFQQTRFSIFTCPLLAIAFIVTPACTTKDNPDEIRQRTADATAAMRRDTKAVAEGVKEGLHRDQDETVDLNKASKEQLLNLPGIRDRQADRIIADRPYRSTHELVTRQVIAQEEYDRIKDRIAANQ
jgi:Helix-hairpin-helix motif